MLHLLYDPEYPLCITKQDFACISGFKVFAAFSEELKLKALLKAFYLSADRWLGNEEGFCGPRVAFFLCREEKGPELVKIELHSIGPISKAY